MNENAAPVKVGEEYEVNITAVGGKGDGIAKVKGFVLFVSGAKKGFSKVRITKVLVTSGLRNRSRNWNGRSKPKVCYCFCAGAGRG